MGLPLIHGIQRPETIPVVFDKFFRVDGTKSGGLGLGLSIVRGMVESHNGTASVENRVNGGARYTIAIPSDIPDMMELKLVE